MLPPSQRYLDEAEKEKQQYLKELWAYQQSEAYKVCTEKIQENKIKKGAWALAFHGVPSTEVCLVSGRSHQCWPWPGRMGGRLRAALADPPPLPIRGLRLWAHEHAPEWAQGKGLSGQEDVGDKAWMFQASSEEEVTVTSQSEARPLWACSNLGMGRGLAVKSWSSMHTHNQPKFFHLREGLR